MVGGFWDLSGDSFIRAQIPFTKAPASWFKYLPKVPRPKTSTSSFRVSTYKFGVGVGDTNIQTIALCKVISKMCYHFDTK